MKLVEVHSALECECCSLEIDFLHDVIATSDVSIAKALMVSEVARIARVESRMREYLTAKWRNRAAQASARAGAAYKSTGKLKSAFAAVDKVMSKWDEDVAKRYASDISEIYYLARNAGWKKANGQIAGSLQYSVPNFTEKLETKKAKAKQRVPELKPSFDLYDEQAVIQLHDDQMLWIGSHYDRNVRDSVRESVQPSVLEGVSRREAGKRVAEAIATQLGKITVPGGFNGSDAKYFEGLAANTATNARVRGQVRSFLDIGVTRYEIVNPMDRRTTPICAFMNGRVFTVRDAASLIETVSGATTPEQVKSAHPWLSFSKVQQIGKGGERALANAGLSLPPYHFRCRTTIDVSEESVSFSALSKIEMVGIPNRKDPTRSNTPKNQAPTTKPTKKTPVKRPATLPRNAKILKAA